MRLTILLYSIVTAIHFFGMNLLRNTGLNFYTEYVTTAKPGVFANDTLTACLINL